MNRDSLFFTAPRHVELRTEKLPSPEPGEVQVAAICSAISTGTEMLLYKGEAPADLVTDATLPALTGSLAFPLKYGYSMVGQVTQPGQGVDQGWKGKLVFAFNPHETDFNAAVADLQPLPASCSEQDAAFLPAAETAVNLILDGAPRLSERVVVLGQGLIGLFTTALLAQHPLENLLTFDAYATRRKLSQDLGVTASFDPQDSAAALAKLGSARADLVYELTGNPAALDLAIELAGDYGRVVVGSWYGERRAEVGLGARFHRGRIRLSSSQVSTIEPALRGRWDSQRRFAAAWKLLAEMKPSRFARSVPFEQATLAFESLDSKPEENLAFLLTYKH